MAHEDHRGSARARRALIAALFLILGALAPAPAIGADPKGSDVSKQAQQLFDAGLVAVKLNQWEKARTFLLGAWRVHRHWLIAAHLGRVEIKLGHTRDAAEHLSFFLREGQKMTADDRRQAEAMLAQARARTGTLVLGASPPGAKIHVDGEPVGTAPLPGPVFVDPGPHRVEASAEGYLAAERDVTLDRGQEARVDLMLTPAPLNKAAVAASADARKERPGPNKKVVIAGVVVSATALGIGVGFMAASFANSQAKPPSESHEFKACQQEPDVCDYNTAHRARNTFANVSFYGLITAGTLGVATLTYAVWPRARASDVKPAVAPLPGGVAATLTGHW